MKLLLDTHVVIWWLEDRTKLTADAINAIDETSNEVFVSAVVAWEMTIKRQLGKLRTPPDFVSTIASAGFSELPISIEHGLAVESLPLHHRDPFDRMLIAQAIQEGCTLVTRDSNIQRYSVPLIVA